MHEEFLVRRKNFGNCNLEKAEVNFYYLFGQEMKPSKTLTENASCSENEKRAYAEWFLYNCNHTITFCITRYKLFSGFSKQELCMVFHIH